MRGAQIKPVHRKVRWWRVFLVIFIVMVITTAISAAAIYAYLNMFHTPVDTATATVMADKNAAALNKRINILLLGVDDGDNETPGAPRRSDTMIVASINPEDGKINLLSIPRDSRVMIPGHKGYDKITHAFAYGGAELSVRTVEDSLHIPINYYVVIDWQAFIKVVDVLGGVDLYVEHAMDYNDPYDNLYIHLSKGYQHLDGAKAGQYVRFRHDELGDIGRVQRQQRFLKTMTDEIMQIDTVFKLPALASTISNYVRTDMTPMMMLKMANSLKSMKSDGLHMEMLPGNFATIDNLSYWVPDKERTRKLIETMFITNPAEISGTSSQK